MSSKRSKRDTPANPGSVAVLNDIYDSRIALAFVRAEGDLQAALADLGFDVLEMSESEREQKGNELAARPGVQRMFTTTLQDVDAAKALVLRRQLAVALAAEDGASLQAAYFIANMMGWMAPKKVDDDGVRKPFNLNVFLSDDRAKKQLLSAADLLTHEPGEAVEIFSEAKGR